MSTAASLQSFNGAVVVMGVASCGKTTLGEALAKTMQLPFVEGDKLHSAANVAKMSSGIPLTDDDRWPWLQQVGEALRGSKGVIASCSALKKSYRIAISAGAERSVIFIHLHGSELVLAKRIAARKGHFMPASLLANQLATLEIPDATELVLTIDVTLSPARQLERAVNYLNGRLNLHG